MIGFFRRLRHKLLSENKFSKYLLYAIGEIALVVIGILIALQINNANEDRKERIKEVNALTNLKTDLRNELKNNEEFATHRFETAKVCSALLNANTPQTIEESMKYTDQYEMVFGWRGFVPTNNTFKELLSSGNLSLIKNEKIKNALLELDKFYTSISQGEYHMRREYEQYLYDVHVKNISAIEFLNISQPKYGFPDRLKIEDIPESKHKKIIEDTQWQSNDQTFTNGLKLAMMNNSALAGAHKNMEVDIEELIELIEEDIKTPH